MMRIIFCASLCLLTVKSFAYPQIMDWKNSPNLVFDDKRKPVLKKKEALTTSFFATTARMDELQLRLNSVQEASILNSTKVHLTDLSDDESKTAGLQLLDGVVRLKSGKKERGLASTLIKTLFFERPLPFDADLLLEIDLNIPQVTVKMVKGTWDLEFFSYEKKIQLKAGEQVSFTGQSADEPGQIKYDYLLDDKKIPKGRLDEVKKFDVVRYLEEEKDLEVQILKKHEAAQRKVRDDARKKKIYEDSFLCKRPFAQINQCAWRIEGGQCFRQRCNVSGEWGDRTERPVSDKCTKDFLIGKCDY